MILLLISIVFIGNFSEKHAFIVPRKGKKHRSWTDKTTFLIILSSISMVFLGVLRPETIAIQPPPPKGAKTLSF